MDKLTYRQQALIILLESDNDVFRKRTFVPHLMDQKMWKYTNSLVDGNCQWFGGRTTRKNTKERGKIHQSKLGFESQLKMITHENLEHTEYRMNRQAIKIYLMATLSRKYDMRMLHRIIGRIETKHGLQLREGMEHEGY